MIKYNTIVRLFERQDNGKLSDIHEEFHLEELGDQIPGVGDLIIDQGMNHPEEDRYLPEQRTFYEVVRRYILTESPRNPEILPEQKVIIRIALEVRVRPGRADEAAILP